MSPELSIVVPTWNAARKLDNCLQSLAKLRQDCDLEVVFVDDASSDDTADRLASFCTARPWASTIVLAENSGGPSHPRNVGLEAATGTYVFFLDIDDEVLPAGVLASLALAAETDADVVRAPLVRDDARGERVLNAIPNWAPELTRRQRIELIIAHQSTTVCGLVRRSLLMDRGVRWERNHRMGEDTIFLLDVLAVAQVIEYSPLPDFRYVTTAGASVKSSTQQYQDRELADHLAVWTRATQVLAPAGIDYFALRGQVALQAAFSAMRRYNRGGFSKDLFEGLSSMLRDNRAVVSSYPFSQRNKELLATILDGDYFAFLEAIKLHLLVAGMDLKFIEAALPALREEFQVQVDRWTGHDAHDTARSERLLRWADVIHCEWMLGNAVWYARRKRDNQKLLVRLHRFELTRSFGEHLPDNRVDRVICVSLPTLEDTQQRFGFAREKLRLIPNFVDVERYQTTSDPFKVFNLAIVGIVGSNKGYHRALELLADLRRVDERYTLSVLGKAPQEVPWVLRDPAEADYYEACQRFIDDQGLGTAINFLGWCDTRKALADKGFVLSMSDFESFHVAPAEAFAAGNIGLFLPWRGVEYIHPSRYICADVAAMRDRILSLRDLGAFQAEAAEGVQFVRENFSLQRFVADYAQLVHDTVDETVG